MDIDRGAAVAALGDAACGSGPTAASDPPTIHADAAEHIDALADASLPRTSTAFISPLAPTPSAALSSIDRERELPQLREAVSVVDSASWDDRLLPVRNGAEDEAAFEERCLRPAFASASAPSASSDPTADAAATASAHPPTESSQAAAPSAGPSPYIAPLLRSAEELRASLLDVCESSRAALLHFDRRVLRPWIDAAGAHLERQAAEEERVQQSEREMTREITDFVRKMRAWTDRIAGQRTALGTEGAAAAAGAGGRGGGAGQRGGRPTPPPGSVARGGAAGREVPTAMVEFPRVHQMSTKVGTHKRRHYADVSKPQGGGGDGRQSP